MLVDGWVLDGGWVLVGDMIRYVSRYRSHDMIRVTVQKSCYDTRHDTEVMIRYVSRYRSHDR